MQPTTGSPITEQIAPEVGDPGYLALYSDTRSRQVQNILQLDYTNPLSAHHSLEAGLKHTFDRSEEVGNNSYEGPEATHATHGTSTLRKHIFGLYGGYAYTTTKLALRLGARLESARYRLDSENEGSEEAYTSRLTNLVPYASLTLTPKQGSMWALSYTQRLRRPGVEAMSPYVNEQLASRDYGNPNLETGVTHQFNLRYSRMENQWSLAVGATTNFSSNLASQYSFVDDEGLLNTTYANRGRMQFYLLDLALSWRPSAKFNLSLSGRGGWGSYRLTSQGIRSEGWCYTQSLNAMVALWKGARLTLSEYCSLPEPAMTSRWKKPILFTSLRLGQKLCKERLECSVTLQNPCSKQMRFEQQSDTPTYLQTTRYENAARSVRFSLSWRFGKQGIAVKQTNRKADTHTEEMETNKSSAAGGGMMN